MSTPQATPTARPRLLGVSGSLRRGSHCTAILHALAPWLAARAHYEVMTLLDVPPYNADTDGAAAPIGVQRLKQAIAEADGLVICSPEYNYGIPGVLKNAIDWASRPGFQSPLKGKPALVITASPGLFGGVRAQAQIRDALAATLARPVLRPHLAVPAVDKKIVDGRMADEPTQQLLQLGLADLLAEIPRPALEQVS
ncbi:NADPH-dependent FMN reductase [Aquabacterium sp.]|uniref:NADPH-dependent FMN reductase n=1 Tax=Aquabacterium sp. TaxID=1872578 RepID=UPI003782DA86